MSITPTVGRIVLYKLSEQDQVTIRRRRGAGLVHAVENAMDWLRGLHEANDVAAGEVYPMIITRVWGDTPDACVNGTVFLDGPDTLWVTSRHCGDQPGDYDWMPFQKGQAAKTEALQAQLGAQAQGGGVSQYPAAPAG